MAAKMRFLPVRDLPRDSSVPVYLIFKWCLIGAACQGMLSGSAISDQSQFGLPAGPYLNLQLSTSPGTLLNTEGLWDLGQRSVLGGSALPVGHAEDVRLQRKKAKRSMSGA
jgi:hypothetical protein